jgi:hypothetical protein
MPPDEWGKMYPECFGKRQSPILLSAQTTSECKTDSSSWYFVSGGCTLANAKAKSRPSNWVCAAFQHLHLLAASNRLSAAFAAAACCSCIAHTHGFDNCYLLIHYALTFVPTFCVAHTTTG